MATPVDDAGGPAPFGAMIESFDLAFSELMATGFDNGDGFANRLFASDDPRGGMLTSLASFLAIGVACSTAGLGVVIVGPSRFDYRESISDMTGFHHISRGSGTTSRCEQGTHLHRQPKSILTEEGLETDRLEVELSPLSCRPCDDGGRDSTGGFWTSFFSGGLALAAAAAYDFPWRMWGFGSAN